MTQHLNHQQLCELLLEFEGPGQQSSPRHSAQLEASQDHIANCLVCASELEFLRGAITSFRAASIAVADRELVRHPIRRPFAALDAGRVRGFLSPTFFWAATALLMLAILPMGIYRSNFNPFARPTAAPAADSSTSVHVSSAESDEALLEGIDRDLSADIPSAMEPLAGVDSSSPSASNSTHQRKN